MNKEEILDKSFSSPYYAGYDCGLNGPDIVNCSFTWFRTRYDTDEWELGKKDGEKSRARRNQSQNKTIP